MVTKWVHGADRNLLTPIYGSYNAQVGDTVRQPHLRVTTPNPEDTEHGLPEV